MLRPYFEKQAITGRRVVFQWNPARRWPNRGELSEDIIEGCQFETEADAATFNVNRSSDWERFASWDEAHEWVNQ